MDFCALSLSKPSNRLTSETPKTPDPKALDPLPPPFSDIDIHQSSSHEPPEPTLFQTLTIEFHREEELELFLTRKVALPFAEIHRTSCPS
jgi:hypothetical protein